MFKCGLTESHVGQIERGEILLSVKALDKIAICTGSDINYILYGKPRKLTLRKNIDTILDRSNSDEMKMYFKCISSINGYIAKG